MFKKMNGTAMTTFSSCILFITNIIGAIVEAEDVAGCDGSFYIFLKIVFVTNALYYFLLFASPKTGWFSRIEPLPYNENSNILLFFFGIIMVLFDTVSIYTRKICSAGLYNNNLVLFAMPIINCFYFFVLMITVMFYPKDDVQPYSPPLYVNPIRPTLMITDPPPLYTLEQHDEDDEEAPPYTSIV